AQGTAHSMAGLLAHETSFATRRLHLGYRTLTGTLPKLMAATALAAHEFHYSEQTAGLDAGSNAAIHDADGARVDTALYAQANVVGSYLHLIDRAEPT
ncbi:MAG: cobyrinic acid a,c-diamide synthase, partial [Pseudomonadota bacterium]